MAQIIATQNYHKAMLNSLFKQIDTNIVSLNIAIAKAEVDNKDSNEYKKLLFKSRKAHCFSKRWKDPAGDGD